MGSCRTLRSRSAKAFASPSGASNPVDTVLHDFRHAERIAADDTGPGRLSLQGDEPESLADGRPDEQVMGGILGGKLFGRQRAEPADTVGGKQRQGHDPARGRRR